MQAIDLEKIAAEVERIKVHVGLPDDDWRTLKPALTAMGISRSVDWLRSKLERAKYAHDIGQDCPLEMGVHYTLDEGAWMVNVIAIKPILLSGELVLPKIPEDLGG